METVHVYCMGKFLLHTEMFICHAYLAFFSKSSKNVKIMIIQVFAAT